VPLAQLRLLPPVLASFTHTSCSLLTIIAFFSLFLAQCRPSWMTSQSAIQLALSSDGAHSRLPTRGSSSARKHAAAHARALRQTLALALALALALHWHW
jgi:hypothetical protein